MGGYAPESEFTASLPDSTPSALQHFAPTAPRSGPSLACVVSLNREDVEWAKYKSDATIGIEARVVNACAGRRTSECC